MRIELAARCGHGCGCDGIARSYRHPPPRRDATRRSAVATVHPKEGRTSTSTPRRARGHADARGHDAIEN
ncbi:hypothetical protein U9M48_006015 [Paspalum notatum var. saurae]|uniref:Uncharacterized protein n=1 Tax=Paspalum notatum var. saurae TaxID=547442 RepID=A0AAQ3SFV1_PASNO